MEIEGIKLEEDVKLENAIFRLKRVHGLGCENHEAIKIVLQNLENLIKAYKETKQENKELSEANTKLAEENTKLNKILEDKYFYVEGCRTAYARLMCLDKEEIVKDDLSLRNEIKQKYKENIKLNKIIDKMAEHIVNSAVADDTVCYLKYGCEDKECNYEEMLECTKQYFREEVEE